MYLQRFAGPRTEPATPKRRQEARRRGQVARSVEVPAAALLLISGAVLQWAGGGIAARLLAVLRDGLSNLPSRELDFTALRDLLRAAAAAGALAAAPLALAGAIATVAAEVAQLGFLFTLETLRFDFERINPVLGLQRLLSRRAALELLKSLAKATIVGMVVYRAVRREVELLPDVAAADPGQAAIAVGGAAAALFWQVGLALAALAAADYFYQRWDFERSMRMTKEEVREELRESEGDPRVHARIRERQRAIARRRMMQEVPRADVVVTNPLHYAVALRYEAASMPSPRVVAKGQGLIAERIKAIARAAGVPLVESPALAQSLYRTVEVGDYVPPELYQAVAEVLAFVYRARRRVTSG